MSKIIFIDSSKFCLIGKIKGLAIESKRTRNRLRKSKSEIRSSTLTYRKHVLGSDVRHHLLAYAFLRGTPYFSLEKKCRKDNMPNVDSILNIVLAHVNHSPHFIKQWEERIENWLKGESK